MINLTLPLPPSANVYWRKARNGVIYVSDKAQTFKNQVGWACIAEKVEPIEEGAVAMRVDAYICDRKRDLDNVCKVLFDALQGYAYTDDNQIEEYHVRRFKAATRKTSVVVVSIWKL